MKVPSSLYTCLGTRKPSLQWSLKYPYTLKEKKKNGKKRHIISPSYYHHSYRAEQIFRNTWTLCICFVPLLLFEVVSFCTNVRRNIVTSCSRKIVDLVPKSSLTSATAYFFFYSGGQLFIQ